MRPPQTEHQHRLRGVRALYPLDQRRSLQGAKCCPRIQPSGISFFHCFPEFLTMTSGRSELCRRVNLCDWWTEWQVCRHRMLNTCASIWREGCKEPWRARLLQWTSKTLLHQYVDVRAPLTQKTHVARTIPFANSVHVNNSVVHVPCHRYLAPSLRVGSSFTVQFAIWWRDVHHVR